MRVIGKTDDKVWQQQDINDQKTIVRQYLDICAQEEPKYDSWLDFLFHEHNIVAGRLES